MYTVTRETMIIDILENAPQTQTVFRSIGLGCMGCSMARAENVEQACAAHNIEVDGFVNALNEYIAANQ